MYNASDATKIPLREKAVKKEKQEPKIRHKRGRPKKGETREPIKPTILAQLIEDDYLMLQIKVTKILHISNLNHKARSNKC